jgi:hypothetical protein
MRLSSIASSFVLLLLAGCASNGVRPVASAQAPSGNPSYTGVEIRHMYLFAPGKPPVRIVSRDDGAQAPEEVSSEPPTQR